MESKKLNYGCGWDIREGWVNVDWDTRDEEWVRDDWYEEMYLGHILEHFDDPLVYMERLWEVAKEGCRMEVRVPYGSSDDAWENPHHVRPWFVRSFEVFGQQYWWRDKDATYGGDWRVEETVLFVNNDRTGLLAVEQVMEKVYTQRNIVVEMMVRMRAVKPAREFEKGVKPGIEEWGNYEVGLVPVDPRTRMVVSEPG